MSLKLIQTLLNLARADGKVSGSELALIYKIAIEKGLPMFEVEKLIQYPNSEKGELSALSSDEKFEYIYTIILMMKMDGVLDDRESALCSQYAAALGYNDQVIPHLMNLIESDHELSENKEVIKQEVQTFLK